MAKNTYQPIVLINEALFKLHSPVTDNTVITEFIPYLSIAQELYIEPIIGTALSEELKHQISTNTLTPENGDLIVKIAPVLSFYTVYQGLPFKWATVLNKGITVRESENSKAVDIKDIAQLRSWLKNDAEVLASQLIDYLCKCRGHYPLWMPSDECACKSTYSEGSATKKFESGIYFKHKNKTCNTCKR